MKQFSLEEYIKNPSRKIITRDGRNVRIICINAKGNFPIIALVETHNDTEVALRLKEDGYFYNDTEDPRDLFFATEKHKGWINIYKYGSKYITSEIIYTKKEDAIMGKNKNYLTTIKIEWEE